jgi:hypothetical protein
VTTHARFATDEVRRLLAANGLCDLESAFRRGEPLDELHDRRASRHEYKRVVKVDLNGSAGIERVYIKRQWRMSRWIPRLTDILHRTRIRCAPIHEWHGLHILQHAGFHVSEPLALFWRGWGFSRGAIITRAVPPQYSLADMLTRGDLQSMSAERWESLILAVANVIARMHRARISWRSMKAKHFYPEEVAQGEWRIWLIDCEGVSRRSTPRDRWGEWRQFLRYIGARAPRMQDSLIGAYNVALSV